MKSFFATLIVFASLTTFASSDETKTEALKLANVILDNPTAVAEIRKENLNIVDYTVESVEAGVTKFTFKLARTCYCIPEEGTLTITQDMRPTYADGAIKYTTDLKINKN